MMEGDYFAHEKGPPAVSEPSGSCSLSFFCAVHVAKWCFTGSILQPPRWNCRKRVFCFLWVWCFSMYKRRLDG